MLIFENGFLRTNHHHLTMRNPIVEPVWKKCQYPTDEQLESNERFSYQIKAYATVTYGEGVDRVEWAGKVWCGEEMNGFTYEICITRTLQIDNLPDYTYTVPNSTFTTYYGGTFPMFVPADGFDDVYMYTKRQYNGGKLYDKVEGAGIRYYKYIEDYTYYHQYRNTYAFGYAGGSYITRTYRAGKNIRRGNVNYRNHLRGPTSARHGDKTGGTWTQSGYDGFDYTKEYSLQNNGVNLNPTPIPSINMNETDQYGTTFQLSVDTGL